MLSNHLILCHPRLLLHSISPGLLVFTNELALSSGSQSVRASTSVSVLPMNTQGWFSLALTVFDLLAVQGTLTSLVQHHNLKASILQHSVFFMVQLLHLYMTTGKTVVLTIQTFVAKMMFLFFNTLSMLVMAFLPRSKCLWISWLQSLTAMILEPSKIKCHCFHFFPFYLPWPVGTIG